MYRPSLENLIGSFLVDADRYLRAIVDPNSYMQYSRHVIPCLSIAMEVLLKETARNRIQEIKPLNQDQAFDTFVRTKFGNRSELTRQILNKSISLANLLKIYKMGTQTRYFALQSIQSDLNIQILDDFRKKSRNKLFHEGELSPSDQSTIDRALVIISQVFKEIYGHTYHIGHYSERIQRIPNERPYSYVRELYLSILSEIELALDNSKTCEAWKIYSISKFIIFFLCNEVIENVGSDYFKDLLRLFHDFAHFESKDLRELQFRLLFKEISFLEIYPAVKKIQEKIFEIDVDPDERILNWTELDIIKTIMKEKVKSKNVPKTQMKNRSKVERIIAPDVNYHIDEGKIEDDNKFFELLIMMTNYSRTRNALLKREPIHQEWRKKWREERNREDKTYEENEVFLEQLVSNYREKISTEIALDTFKLSLLFYERYYERYKHT